MKSLWMTLRQRSMQRGAAAAIMGCVAIAGGNAHAQLPLQITEVMSDTLSAGDDAWEWIEVRNTGATPINLDGYVIDRLGDTVPGVISPGINGALTSNTIIPAGGVAILYDADVAISAADYNDALFRQAWGLAPSVPLIGVTGGFGGGLTNGGGTAIGFWQDSFAYGNDVADDGTGAFRVAQFNNAAFSFDFRTASGFPSIDAGVSLAWNGTGSHQNGANWGPTTLGTTSVAVTLPGSTNNPADRGNPGLFPSGTPGAGLFVTEIMYNPASTDSSWEWVEIFNNTGNTIDFGATPYVFDDDDDTALTAANITSGVIPNGTGAVLFRGGTGGITLSDMQAAWDPEGTRGTNFIAVQPWSTELGNNGDRFGIWPSITAYTSEEITSSATRTMANALAVAGFDDATVNVPGLSGSWPLANGSSIYLISYGTDQLVGESWALSTEGDAMSSFNAAAIAGSLTVHPGGDLGTPGTFVAGATIDADFNNDNIVDGADFLIWQRGFGTGNNNATGDADGNNVVDAADLAAWKAAFGSAPASATVGAVPEPAALGMLAVALAGVAGLRRRSQ